MGCVVSYVVLLDDDGVVLVAAVLNPFHLNRPSFTVQLSNVVRIVSTHYLYGSLEQMLFEYHCCVEILGGHHYFMILDLRVK